MRRIARHVEDAAVRFESPAPHVGQVGGGVGKGAAALGAALVHPIAVAVEILAVRSIRLHFAPQFPIPPVERDHRRIAFFVAAEIDGIGVVEQLVVALLGRQAVAGGFHVLAREAFVETLAPPLFLGRVGDAEVVDTVHEDDHARQGAGRGDRAIIDPIGQRAGTPRADVVLARVVGGFNGNAHDDCFSFRIRISAMRIASRASSSVLPLASETPLSVLPSVRSIS